MLIMMRFFRMLARFIRRHAKLLIGIGVLATVGYIAGNSFVKLGAPWQVKYMGAAVFVIMGLQEFPWLYKKPGK